MDIAHQMILFAKVVDKGEFSAAARDLGLNPSAVSRQIGSLEVRLGTRLLNRSTSRLSLTEIGTAFYDRCTNVARNVEDAEAMVLSLSDHPQGTLRITATSAFAKTQMLPMMPDFLNANPDINISLELTDRPLDLVQDKIDVAIRFTEQVNDISVVAHKLAVNRRVYCASPSYLAKFGMPKTPEDLANHNCLRLSTVEAFNNWEIGNTNGTSKRAVSGNFEINSTDGLYHAVVSGLGIAKLSTYMVNEGVRNGQLVCVLPDHIENASDILAIFQNSKNMSPNVRAFVDFLAERFGPLPPWERENQAVAS